MMSRINISRNAEHLSTSLSLLQVLFRLPVYSLVLYDLHVAMRTSVVCIGVELAQGELMEGQLYKVPVWASGSH